MRILVVGASGLIGGHVAARLLAEGHDVVGAARGIGLASRRQPAIQWLRADLATMDAAAWAGALTGIEAVVNCAGALQDGPADDLQAVHVTGSVALATACVTAGVRRFVQVSAAGVETGPGAFSSTKRRGDAALQSFDLDWAILRPGLVLAPAAFGGSGLLRGLAAFPGLMPAVHAKAVVHVVAVEDLAEAVVRCVRPDGPARIVCDLMAAEPTTLADILIALRAWLGIAPAPLVSLPPALGRIGGVFADALAWLGWKSPMRTTTLDQLKAGVAGRVGDAPSMLGFTPRTLAQILSGRPAGVQERWYAGLYFLKPLSLAVLAGFWLVSGAVGLASADAAAELLTRVGMARPLAMSLVIAGAAADLSLGLLVCFRRTARAALLGMVAVTCAYLAGASLLRPDLWSDPLGPLVKTLPAAVLALIALAMLEDR